MKRIFVCVLALFAITGLFAQQQPVVAVAPFDVISGVSATDAAMITDVFFVRLGNTRKVSLVNRAVVQRAIKEHNFQLEDWSNKDKTAELGKALNADWIVQGDIRKMNDGILVIVQFYDLNTFRFEGGTDVRLANADEAYDKMDPLVDSLIQTISVTVNRPTVNLNEAKAKEEQARKLADEIAWLKTISVIKDTETYTRAMAAINGDTVGGTYTLTIGASFPVGSVEFNSSKAVKTVILKGSGASCILSNNQDHRLFVLREGITLILDSNITLDGNFKKSCIVSISAGGTLIMKSGSEIRNARDSGVSLWGGNFIMDGGSISNNKHDGIGGGVLLYDDEVYKVGTQFIMNGGTINGNKAETGGGGVCVSGGEFIMNGGTISGNSVDWYWGGGGVFIYGGGSFTMYGGTITGNSVAAAEGGGVFVTNGKFFKSGGTIDATNTARKGKVAYYQSSTKDSFRKRDAAAGPNVNMSSIISGRSGGWE